MAATAVQTETSSAQLPPLREDLKLLPGSPHRDGSPSWRIHDPLRNQFFEIGWLLIHDAN
jgi:putative peptide zinc metalloprotease protein